MAAEAEAIPEHDCDKALREQEETLLIKLLAEAPYQLARGLLCVTPPLALDAACLVSRK
jgi:hypothetical protein